ncbi:MAG TPA: hypothetical protein VMU33_07590 [Burkholderiaceae bacterium]|nr:hypothetical protein [Burkholderiaceae bacterium]
MAFITWRVAQQALRNMRRADFEIETGTRYFDFVAEWLIFLAHIADGMAWKRFGPEVRIEFTSALANRIGEIYADNRDELLGPWQSQGPGAVKAGFIDLLNLRLVDYGDFEFQDGVEYGCLRYLASQLACVVGPRDTLWVHEQVMEIEAPQAVEAICKSFRDLLGEEPRAARRRPSVSGE